MKLLGNIIWAVFSGIWLWLFWLLTGALWCITIIGIPVGVQCFKLSHLSLFPFGKKVDFGEFGAAKLFVNILWLIFGGLELAIASALAGVFYCITVIGFPFGLQCFKLARLSLQPFGAKVTRVNAAATGDNAATNTLPSKGE